LKALAAKVAGEASNGYSLDNLREAFEAYDEDGSGEIDAKELADCMTKMGEEGVTIEIAQGIMAQLDKVLGASFTLILPKSFLYM
jgi:Ca2+-binding EF-hand superfamily protein